MCLTAVDVKISPLENNIAFAYSKETLQRLTPLAGTTGTLVHISLWGESGEEEKKLSLVFTTFHTRLKSLIYWTVEGQDSGKK